MHATKINSIAASIARQYYNDNNIDLFGQCQKLGVEKYYSSPQYSSYRYRFQDGSEILIILDPYMMLVEVVR